MQFFILNTGHYSPFDVTTFTSSFLTHTFKLIYNSVFYPDTYKLSHAYDTSYPDPMTDADLHLADNRSYTYAFFSFAIGSKWKVHI